MGEAPPVEGRLHSQSWNRGVTGSSEGLGSRNTPQKYSGLVADPNQLLTTSLVCVWTLLNIPKSQEIVSDWLSFGYVPTSLHQAGSRSSLEAVCKG